MGGNVGIGTPAPGTKLHVKGATDSDGTSLATIKATGGIILENAASTSALNIDDNELNSSGLFYINTSNGNGLNVGGNMTTQSPTTVAGITIKGLGDGANSSYLKFSNNSASNAWQYSVRQVSPFNLDLSYYDGATWSSLQVWNQSTGHIRLPGYGAGTLVTDASGNVTVSSDARLKNVIGNTQTGLSQVMELRGRRWHWKPDSGMDTAGTYEGFVAQDVQKLVPTAVGQDSKGYLSLSYVSLLPTFANAIRELKAEKDNQVIALEKRATSAEQKLSAAVSQSNRDKAAADSRIAALEKRLNEELMARQQQEIRVAKLEQMLQRQVMVRR